MSLLSSLRPRSRASSASFFSSPTPPRYADEPDVPAGRRRPVLMLAVMLLCGAGFWMNFERRFADIEAESGLRDTVGVLTQTDRQTLNALRQTLREQWGLQVRVRVDEQLSAETPDMTILLELNPGSTPPQARVHAPPLVTKALNAANVFNPTPSLNAPPTASPFLDALTLRLTRCAQRSPAGNCLETALVDILLALSDTGANPPPSSPSSSPSSSASSLAPEASAVPEKFPAPETPAGSVWRGPLTGVPHD